MCCFVSAFVFVFVVVFIVICLCHSYLSRTQVFSCLLEEFEAFEGLHLSEELKTVRVRVKVRVVVGNQQSRVDAPAWIILLEEKRTR